jgi:catechol 2,3-dioxygenase-like lactoylglutathione lyase family enzyme
VTRVIDVAGVHHLKVPVTDLARSRAWYADVLSLVVELEFRDDDGTVRGVAFERRGGLTLCLREDAPRARALAGFDPYAVLVPTRADLDGVLDRLQELGTPHSPIITASLGWLVRVADPDGIELRFYTEERHAPNWAHPKGTPA